MNKKPSTQSVIAETAAPGDLLPAARQTYMRRVLSDTFRLRGAKFGLVWLILLAVFAIFGTFLANSHPLVMVDAAGKMSSPMWRYLSATDVILPSLTFLLFVLWLLRRRVPLYGRLAIFAGGGCLVIVLAANYFDPPTPVIYQKYRQMESANQVDWMWRAPVPYSSFDHSHDDDASRSQPPSAVHWLGTDKLGSDVLSQLIHASRIALAIGFIATSISMTLGVLIGGLMGYFSGKFDLIGMRLVEIAEAIPRLFLLLIFVAFIPDRNIYYMMIVIGLTGWSGYARFVRAEFLKLRKQDFVQATIACGLPLRSTLFRHMLPNSLAPVLVNGSFDVASAILAETMLSFLGLGVVGAASWGNLLNQATSSSAWWLAIFPGMMIFLTVFAYTLIGEALRDAIDPHLKKSANL